MSGFFSKSEFIRPAPVGVIPKCGSCQLYQKCKTPKMVPSGQGKRRILIVSETPGKEEDAAGKHLVGPIGRFFEEELADVGISLRRDCILTSTLICQPSEGMAVTAKQVDYCLPNLISTINKHKPEIIIPIGLYALKAVLRGLWNQTIKEIGTWVGWHIPSQKHNAWITPIWHPGFIRKEIDNAKGGTAAPLLFRQQLEAISKIKGRPWKKIPDYKSQVEVVLDDREAARIVKEFTRAGLPGAFDYETDRLKPDHKEATIRTTSISWGDRTISFPMQGKVVSAFKAWLASPCGKIAQNNKFEDRWTRAVLKMEVNNWIWCTMNQGHVVDFRPGCTGLGFQALAYEGIGAYDHHIHPFLDAEHANDTNRIWDIDIEELCVYNGLDSLLEYKIAVKQRKLLKQPVL